jgi:hypothetical protein
MKLRSRNFNEKLKAYLVLVTTIIMVVSCKNKDLTDPFWDINLKWDSETTTNMLYDNSRKGKLINCVFSFDKEFYVKSQKMDARIKASLNYPTFERSNLKSLEYSLVVDFKNETITKFNPYFFAYFKKKMISCYGNNYEEYTEDNTINLTWKIENEKTIKAMIFRDINCYNVSINLKN